MTGRNHLILVLLVLAGVGPSPNPAGAQSRTQNSVATGSPGAKHEVAEDSVIGGDLEVRGGDLSVRGVVKGDVRAGDGRVTVWKGAEVGGTIHTPDPELVDVKPGAKVGAVRRIDLVPAASDPPEALEPPAPHAAPEAPPALPLRHSPGFGEWVAAQAFLVLFGLLFALLALTFAPRATTLAAAILDSEPIRCLVVGAMGLAGLGLLNVVNGLLFYTVIWIPAGMVLAVLSGLVVVFSTLLGIAFMGGAVGRRLGWKGLSFYGCTAVGLVTLGILNCVPVVNLGSLAAQTIAPVLGLGALIITGFGRDRDWLSTRLADAGRAFREEE